ncbi:hypothetical protein V1520DRAFT_331653 [Lipomyces starkeyi]
MFPVIYLYRFRSLMLWTYAARGSCGPICAVARAILLASSSRLLLDAASWWRSSTAAPFRLSVGVTLFVCGILSCDLFGFENYAL